MNFVEFKLVAILLQYYRKKLLATGLRFSEIKVSSEFFLKMLKRKCYEHTDCFKFGENDVEKPVFYEGRDTFFGRQCYTLLIHESDTDII